MTVPVLLDRKEHETTFAGVSRHAQWVHLGVSSRFIDCTTKNYPAFGAIRVSQHFLVFQAMVQNHRRNPPALPERRTSLGHWTAMTAYRR